MNIVAADVNSEQAALLIAALKEQLRLLTPNLRLAEREAAACEPRTPEGKATREVVISLRRDVDEARLLIRRLRRRYPEAALLTAPTGRKATGARKSRNGTKSRSDG